MTFAFHEHAWLAVSATSGACGDGVQVSCTFDLAEGAWEAFGSQVALDERYKAFSTQPMSLRGFHMFNFLIFFLIFFSFYLIFSLEL